MTLDEFDRAIESEGFALLPAVVSLRTVEVLCHAMQCAYTICRKAQEIGGVAQDMEGSVHHLPAVNPAFIDFLDGYPAGPYIEQFFEPSSKGKYILNSMGGNYNLPGGNYASRVHRDVRSFWHDRIMLNTLVTLDDMTVENGATWLMPGSHRLPIKPCDSEFNAKAVQIAAPVGSVLMWDSRLWHRAGENKTDQPRRIITPIFTVPGFKQGFDYSRAVGYLREGLSIHQRQVLGYTSRVPASLDEWYRKDRFYQAGQG